MGRISSSVYKRRKRTSALYRLIEKMGWADKRKLKEREELRQTEQEIREYL